MKIKHLLNVTTLEELKAAYRKLAFKFHPDHSGSLEQMQELNNEYSYLSKKLSDAANDFNKTNKDWKQNKKYENEEQAAEFMEIIEKLMNCTGLEIEICGTWIWLSGNTKEHRELIKSLHFKWAKLKKMWCFGTSTGKGRGKTSMDDIRNKYGSTTFNGPKGPKGITD